MEYGKDYTIVYPNDLTSAGAKKFTVVGMGLYHKITSAQIRAEVEVGGAPADDTALEVIYVNNTNKGKATVIVKGTDTDGCIYAGSKKAAFSIVARGLDILNCLFGNT